MEVRMKVLSGDILVRETSLLPDRTRRTTRTMRLMGTVVACSDSSRPPFDWQVGLKWQDQCTRM